MSLLDDVRNFLDRNFLWDFTKRAYYHLIDKRNTIWISRKRHATTDSVFKKVFLIFQALISFGGRHTGTRRASLPPALSLYAEWQNDKGLVAPGQRYYRFRFGTMRTVVYRSSLRSRIAAENALWLIMPAALSVLDSRNGRLMENLRKGSSPWQIESECLKTL